MSQNIYVRLICDFTFAVCVCFRVSIGHLIYYDLESFWLTEKAHFVFWVFSSCQSQIRYSESSGTKNP